MRIIKSNVLTKSQKEAIINLWNREYPRQLAVTVDSFNQFLGFSTGHTHYMILDDVNEIVGWAVTFDRAGDKWFSIIINNLFQHIGLGGKLLNLIKSTEERLNGWVIDHPHDVKQNGDPYISPLNFYLKNGFVVRPDIRLEEEKLSSVKIEWRKV